MAHNQRVSESISSYTSGWIEVSPESLTSDLFVLLKFPSDF